MMSFRTMIDRSRSGDRPMAIGFRIGPERFVAVIDADGIAINREEPEGVDAVIDTDPVTLASVVYGGRPLSDAEAAGGMAITGDRALAERFFTLFLLPPKI